MNNTSFDMTISQQQVTNQESTLRKTEADNRVEIANTGCLRPEVHMQAMLAAGWEPSHEHVYQIWERKVGYCICWMCSIPILFFGKKLKTTPEAPSLSDSYEEKHKEKNRS